ncbi:MAG: HD-GYP domain-containing protein [Candidatus Zipacnadales bacterium]
MPLEAAIDNLAALCSHESRHSTSVVEVALSALARLWGGYLFYPRQHPVIADRLSAAYTALSEALTTSGSLTVKCIEANLIYEDHRLFVRSPAPTGFISALQRCNVECLTFQSGISQADLAGFCWALANQDSATQQHRSLKTCLSDANVKHIELDQLAVCEKLATTESHEISPARIYESALAIARHTLQSAQLGRPLDVNRTHLITEQMIALVLRDAAQAIGLACLRDHDEYSFTHSVHTALLSLALGYAIGFNTEELRELGMAAMLHDVGKARTPLHVLRKPGRLTTEEWRMITQHPSDGASILLEQPDLPPITPVVAFEHHLRADLSGYPRPCLGRALSLLSHIVAIADVYDALTTYRPYRSPLRPDHAVAEVSTMAGKHLHPLLTNWFQALLGVYPPGTPVLLNTNECGIVCRANTEYPTRPCVLVVIDASGVRRAEPYEVDLAATFHGCYTRSIVAPLPPAQLGCSASTVLEGWLKREEPPSLTPL